ncbi:MAG: response regulator transcription factor [Gammaproteobacteria bacterium]|nr:response regulator transcription factor [Gammaproteobacteria bacterium]MBV9621191.1 response regulator transcription factor [Gammaproteobacteria bacterium]
MIDPDGAPSEESPTLQATQPASLKGPSPRIRVLIIDEPGLCRDGLQALLEGEKVYEVVGATASRREALQILISRRPQIVLLDFSSALKTGPDTVAHLKRRWPDIGVLVLTLSREEPCIEAALRAGANAYVLKSDTRVALFTALERIQCGQGFISAPALEKVVTAYVGDGGSATTQGGAGRLLTEREREVIALVARGYRTREMAALLSLSHKTVEKHRTNLMRKLGLRSAAAVAAYAITHGFL